MARGDPQGSLLDRLQRAQRRPAVDAVQAWFLDDRGEDVGELAAGFLIEAVVDAIGPAIYNLGVRDATGVLTQHHEIVEADLAALLRDEPAPPESPDPS